MRKRARQLKVNDTSSVVCARVGGMRAQAVPRGVLVLYGQRNAVRQAFEQMTRSGSGQVAGVLEVAKAVSQRSPLARYLFVLCNDPALAKTVVPRLAQSYRLSVMKTSVLVMNKKKRTFVQVPGVLSMAEWKELSDSVAVLDVLAGPAKIRPGASVFVTGGPFKGFNGIVISCTAGVAVVELVFFNQPTRQSIPVEMLKANQWALIS